MAIWQEIGSKAVEISLRVDVDVHQADDVDRCIEVLLTAGMSTPRLRQAALRGVDITSAAFSEAVRVHRRLLSSGGGCRVLLGAIGLRIWGRDHHLRGASRWLLSHDPPGPLAVHQAHLALGALLFRALRACLH